MRIDTIYKLRLGNVLDGVLTSLLACALTLLRPWSLTCAGFEVVAAAVRAPLSVLELETWHMVRLQSWYVLWHVLWHVFCHQCRCILRINVYTFWNTYILTLYLANAWASYLSGIYCGIVSGIYTGILSFWHCIWIHSGFCKYFSITFLLAFCIAIYLAYTLAFNLSCSGPLYCYLAFYLAYLPAFYLASNGILWHTSLAFYVAYILTFYFWHRSDIHSGVLSGIYSDIPFGKFWHSIWQIDILSVCLSVCLFAFLSRPLWASPEGSPTGPGGVFFWARNTWDAVGALWIGRPP